MSGNKLLLDSNIIIYLLDGDKTLSDLLYNKQLYVSVISEIELLSYPTSTPKEEKIIKEFLKECVIVELSKNVTELAINIRKNFKLKIPDSIIIATAIYSDIPLITSDKAFKKVTELELILYEQ